jgi:hypothetical protein
LIAGGREDAPGPQAVRWAHRHCGRCSRRERLPPKPSRPSWLRREWRAQASGPNPHCHPPLTYPMCARPRRWNPAGVPACHVCDIDCGCSVVLPNASCPAETCAKTCLCRSIALATNMHTAAVSLTASRGGREGRRLVFVGDLVDRGPDSVTAVNFVRRLEEKGKRNVPGRKIARGFEM